MISLAGSVDGEFIISGHLDHSIIKMHLERGEKTQIVAHSCIPYALGWGAHIVAAGNDGKVFFYDDNGAVFQKYDYAHDSKVKEFTVSAYSPTGESLAIGNFNKFFVYNYNAKRNQWDEVCVKNIPNLYSVTALTWKSDSSKIVIGSLCGSVDIFDVCMKKSKYKGKFEFTYVALSQVIVKRLETGERTILKSNYGAEIHKINIYKDKYIVAHTTETLLVGDMESCKLSEILWRGSGNEKFDFGNPNVCMIFNAGELLLVEYGINEILGTCRTEYLHPHLISARLSYSQIENETPTRIIAYLNDLQTIRIQDLTNSIMLGTIEHDSKIDFIELNPTGSKLLFRDRRRQLHLYNVKDQKKTTLLNYCNYVNWVPDSDVVVGQNRNNLCVWYSIDEPDKVTMYSIKGDVEDIERTEGKTEVIVDSGSTTISYALDEDLIAFGTALDQGDLDKAVQILEPLELGAETEANWKSLAKIALENQNLLVAERCYASLGNVAKAKYLRNVNKLIKQFEEETKTDGRNFFLVQAKLAMLDKEFHRAEAILLNQNEVEEAMEMYQELHKWDESIKIAEKKNHPEVKELKINYFNWLLESGQEAKAAEVREKEGDYMSAINLYLKGGLPAKAASVVNNYNVDFEQDMLEKIASALTNSEMHEKAGDFFEKMDFLQRALESYIKGHAYNKAVDLAKRAFPSHTVRLEEDWGDWLVSQKQVEVAINHYIEAGIFNKAIEASINASQWNKAVQIATSQPPEIARPFYKQIGKHYADIRQYDLAEKYYVKAKEFVEAFEVYVRANKWDKAYQVIKKNLPDNEVTMLYIKEGQKLEKECQYKEAEKMYLTVNEPDLAINMYKKGKQYDHMIRLVMKYRKDLLLETHHHLAQQLEMEGNLKQAENHYIEAGAWKGAVDLYRARDMWEEAIRVAKNNGTPKEVAEIGKKWAQTMDRDAGRSILMKFGLIEAAVDFEVEQKQFEEAFKLAATHAKYKLNDVHLKYAWFLEDERRFKEAEEEFVKASKPTEAISMYEHLEDWHSALRVARQYYPEGVSQVFLDQANFYLKRKDFGKAEASFINAKQPQLAVNSYLQNQLWSEALRVAKKHAPHLAPEINAKYSSKVLMEASADDLLSSAKMWEDSKEYSRAIDGYLEINTNTKNLKNLDSLEGIWEKAVNLAMSYEKDRVQEVVTEVGKRLESIKRFEQAGELYETIGFYENAVDCYIIAQNWERAKEVANQVRHTELHHNLNDLVEKAYREHLIQTDQPGVLVDEGDFETGLEIYIQRGQWDECLELAQKQGSEVLNKYLLMYTKMLIREGQYKEGADAFVKYGCQPVKVNFPLYRTLSLEILATSKEDELGIVKEMLGRLCDNIAAAMNKNNAVYQEFFQYLLIAHFQLLKSECETLGLVKSYCKLCVSLLRYTKEIRADKCFLDAGNACKQQVEFKLCNY